MALVTPYAARAGITRVAVVTGLDVSPVPVVMVTRPLSHGSSVTQGKGVTLEAARVSGIMEAFEHFHAETVAGQLRVASERELESEGCLSGAHLSARLPAYSPARRLLWQLGHSLLSGTPRWVPFDLVHLDLRYDGLASAPCFVPSSNGLASGNTLEEATAHALYEVIERHLTAAFYDMSVREQERRRLALSSVTDADGRALLEALERAGIAATVWDLTDDLAIPAFFCELIDARDSFRQVPLARGFGCHTSAGVALSRAVCEAAQSRVTLISGARDDIPPLDDAARLARIRAAREQWRLRSEAPAERRFGEVPSREFGGFTEEREWLVASLIRRGFGDVVRVDLSKPGWPMSVVRVIVPGLRYEPHRGQAERTAT